MRRNYKYDIGEKVINKYGNEFEILEQTTGHRGASAYICKCPKDHVFHKLQTKILTSCPYCTNRIVEKGINDISTTNIELFDMLEDKQFGYTHCQSSQEKTNWICPSCNNIVYNKSPYLVLEHGLSCPHCSDGISYGEKFIMNMLDEIGIDYIYQLSSKNTEWCDKFKYDFYVPAKDCIIEVMGLQHYQDTSWGKYEDIHKNDIAKKELALKHVTYYIELDVRKSTLQHIKQSILRNKMDDILELYLYHIPWKKIHKKSLDTILNDVVEKYNTITKDISKLSEIIHISKPTIVRYLKNANELGLCDYNAGAKIKETLDKNHANNSERISKPIICTQDGNVFRDSVTLQDISPKIYNVKLDRRNIWAVCNGKQHTTKKLSFAYISRSEFNKVKNESPEKAYGDFFITQLN